MGRLLISALLLMGMISGPPRAMADTEDVTVFPTYGFRDGDGWKVPLRVWVHEPRSLTEEVVARLALSLGDPDDRELANFRRRTADLVADDESDEAVVFEFDDDPQRERWRVQDAAGRHPESDRNGIIEGFVTLSDDRARALLAAQGSANGWLSFHAVSADHRGRGRVRLLEPDGLSVISDIDDTIKVTEISAGKEMIVRNTFAELAGSDATFNQKVSQISEILRRFPGRRFILVGDSGEMDPEVYRQIRERFPDQIREIRIRDIVDDRENHPERLRGMTVIEAPTVKEGVSEL